MMSSTGKGLGGEGGRKVSVQRAWAGGGGREVAMGTGLEE
jgi:hypothetical protein